MLFDSHIHIGQFFDIYTSPQQMADLLRSIGVDGCLVSSTTIGEEDYQKVIDEIQTFVACFGKNNVIPALWLTPQMLRSNTNISIFLEAGIDWRCIKIHPELHPKQWRPLGRNFSKALDLAQQLKVPVLVHTGDRCGCQPSLFEKVISRHPETIFILAHGRPTEEAISVLQKHPNTYVDTAFMPIEGILQFIDARLEDRVLWGTDLPIQKYFFKDIDLVIGCKNKIEELRKNLVSEQTFKKLTIYNFKKLFNIQ